MQPVSEPRPPVPVWLMVLAGALAAFGVVFFVQTRDPMLLMFSVMAAGMLVVAYLVVRLLAHVLGRGGAVMVRCQACHALNDERSRFCGQCGKPL